MDKINKESFSKAAMQVLKTKLGNNSKSSDSIKALLNDDKALESIIDEIYTAAAANENCNNSGGCCPVR